LAGQTNIGALDLAGALSLYVESAEGASYLLEPKRLGRFSGSANPGGAVAGSCAGGFGAGWVFGGIVATGLETSS